MAKTKKITCDVTIVGGGLAGLTLANCLLNEGFSVALVDRDAPEKTLNADYDGRTTAISFGSQAALEKAGIWDDVIASACPIQDIHIQDNGSAVLLEFLAKDVNADAFGWIFENLSLRKALIKKLGIQKNIRHLAPAQAVDFKIEDNQAQSILNDGTQITSQLIIGADGRGSFVRDWANLPTRQWAYDQTAVTCTVLHENPHNNIAIEDFRSEGPFAVLPMQDNKKGQHRSSVVWTIHGNRDNPAQWDSQSFNAALNARFPSFYGSVALERKAFSYPLGLIHAQNYIARRMALVADAAHGIHPIAGQGLNLGFRDILCLCDLLETARSDQKDLGRDTILQSYERQRRLDNMSMAGATDMLNRLFSNKSTPLRLLRKAGLRGVQKLKPVRKFFMRQAMGQSALLTKLDGR